MKIVVPAGEMKAALARIMGGVDVKAGVPIFGTVHVVAGKTVSVTASNFDVTIAATVSGARIEAPGEACIPAIELARLAALARKDDLTIDCVLVSAIVSFGRTRAELRTLPAGDFPPARATPGDMIPFDGKLLAAAMKFAATAASSDAARSDLCGVFLTADSAGSYAVATDGRRLHKAEMPGVQIGGSAIIPAAMVGLLSEVAASGEAFRLHLSDREWIAENDTVRAQGRVIDGTYPDWRRVLVGDGQDVAIVDANKMRDTIEIASTGAEREGRTTRIVIRTAGDEIEVRGLMPGGALAKGVSTSFQAEIVAPMAGAYSALYLSEILTGLGCDRARVIAVSIRADVPRLEITPAETRPDLILMGTAMGVRISAQDLAA